MNGQNKGRNGDDRAASENTSSEHHTTPPLVTGQCAEVLSLIRKHGTVLSLELTANHAIPETAARVHDLRAKGFNIITEIVPDIVFRGRTRHKVARYSLGAPEWPSPEYLAEHGGKAA